MMKPCWSADLPAALVTATAPLCNQGIHSRFYPASASFFPTERPSQQPSQLALSACPTLAGKAGGAMGASAGEGGVMSPSAGLQRPHRHPGSHFYLPVSILRSRRARAGLPTGLSVASHFVHLGEHQRCAWPEQGRGHIGPSSCWVLC